MFAYCRNNPTCRIDVAGTADQLAYEDGELLNANDLEQLATGAGIGAAATIGGALGAVVYASQKAQTYEFKESKPSSSYTVYFLCASNDPSRTIVYVGRVKSNNFSARMRYHETKGRAYVFSVDGLNYEQCRALEQAGMVFFHTINRGNAINNQIRGVSPTNGNRHIYLAVLLEMVSNGMLDDNVKIPLSYLANLTEETFLNGTI